jgi:hypothetical protein
MAGSSLAWAETKSEIGVGIRGGKAFFSGDLTDDKSKNFYGTEVLVGGVEFSNGSGFHGLFSMSFSNTSANALKSDFPFEPGRLSISQMAIVPNICYRLGLSISGCVGIGFETVEINDHERKNRQKYGEFTEQLRVGKFTGAGFIGGVAAEFAQINQTINGKDSKVSIAPVSVMIGWVYIPS